MNRHEREICEAIERLLRSATGRVERGHIDDVLSRIIRDSEFATLASYPSDGLGLEDGLKLQQALWHVLTSAQADDPLMIKSTIPGISGQSTRFEFAEVWASDLLHGTPTPESLAALFDQSQSSDDRVREVFEQYLVAALVLFAVREACNEFFSFRLVFPALESFCKVMGDPSRIGTVTAQLLSAMTVMEDRYEVNS